MRSSAASQRESTVRTALRLEYLTVGWNVVEGVVALGAALAAGSIALFGFGVDSFVECASGMVLLWRLSAERKGLDAEAIERLDRGAHRLVGGTLFLLAAYVAVDSGRALWEHDRPSPSIVGIALTSLSIAAITGWHARKAVRRRGSRAGRSRPTRSRPRLASGSRSSRSPASVLTRHSPGGGPTPWRRSG